MHIFIFLFLSIISLIAYPDMDVRGNRNENFLELQGRASIQVSKMSYHPGEDILLDFTVKNYGEEVIRFYPTVALLKSYQFVINDENDESVPPKDTILLEDKKQKRRNSIVNLDGDKVKEIIIHKGESFTKRFNLSELYDFDHGKRYYITGYFYPNYLEDNSTFLKSENHSVFLIESKKRDIQPKKYETSEAVSDSITPEETIHLFLSAEMKKNWLHFFKFINFSEFIHAYNKYSKEYSNSDPNYKDLVVEEFKKHLMDQKAGKLSYYRITSRENQTPTLARVYVDIEREVNRYPTKYEYIYSLKKGEETPSGLWKITNVTVKVRR
jgi:hypothetical protein